MTITDKIIYFFVFKYFRLFTVSGIEIKIHSSLMVLLLLTPLSFMYDESEIFLFIFSLYVFLIVSHEIGHALLAKLLKFRVNEIRVGIIHGECLCEGDATNSKATAIIAWGGVCAQLVLLNIALFLLITGFSEINWMLNVFAYFMTAVNIQIIALNLLPVWRFDGVLAWGVFRKTNTDDVNKRRPLKVLK